MLVTEPPIELNREGVLDTLANIDRQLQLGLEHDLLKYLSPDDSVRTAMQNVPDAPILFNYLGNLQSNIDILAVDSGFRVACESVGELHDFAGFRDHALAISLAVGADGARASVVYSDRIHDVAFADDLARAFKRNLEVIAALVEPNLA